MDRQSPGGKPARPAHGFLISVAYANALTSGTSRENRIAKNGGAKGKNYGDRRLPDRAESINLERKMKPQINAVGR